MVGAVKEFYLYLYGFRFTLLTDHNPLTSLKGIKDVEGQLACWMLFLQQFDFNIQYKKGSTNSDADTLSRRPPEHPEVAVLGMFPFLADLDTLVKAQQEDPQLANLKRHIDQGTFPTCCPRGFRKCFL